MLNDFLNDFKEYCVYLSLSINSTKELIRYINQLNDRLKNNNIKELSQLTYKQLLNFAISGEVGPTTVKARIWAMKKFFCYLQLKVDNAATFEGRVLGPDGKPVSGATVRAGRSTATSGLPALRPS